MKWVIPREVDLMQDPLHVEHSADFSAIRDIYPFGEMDKYDFFVVPEEKLVQRTRTAVQRYQEEHPCLVFAVRKFEDHWICRRMV